VADSHTGAFLVSAVARVAESLACDALVASSFTAHQMRNSPCEKRGGTNNRFAWARRRKGGSGHHCPREAG